MRPRIDRHGLAPERPPDLDAVAREREPSDVGVGRDPHDQLGEERLQPRRVLARERLTPVPFARRRSCRFAKLGPRAGGLPVLLVAIGETEHRADAWIEALALGELRARLGEGVRAHETLPLVERGLGGGLVLRGLRARDRRTRGARVSGERDERG